MWKRFISDYLSFSKRERIGVLVLLSGIVIFMLLPFSYPYFIKQKIYDHSRLEIAIASLKIKQADSSDQFPRLNRGNHPYKNYDLSSSPHNFGPLLKSELFYFDPNSISPADWKRLGIKDKTIATIQNYLSKGGKFYKKEDISKIWGLHEDEIQRLTPYIQIKIAANSKDAAEKKYEKNEYKKSVKTTTIVDINIADTAAFIALPGIGDKLSRRIINFRDKLGGFYKVEQIGETFGLADSTYQKIKPFLKISSTSALRQININTASIDEMKAHPYIRYAIANAIFQYRTQHGNFMAVADIKRIMTVTEEIFIKMAPYLSIQ